MAHRLAIPAALVCWFVFASSGHAQYSVISAQQNGVGDSFFENIGVSFGAQFGNNGFFNFGGPAPPPFGGGGGGGGANFGFQAGDPNGTNFRFNLFADQGSSRTLTSNTASVTVPNGGTGSIFSGSLTPFVTGIVPVVGQTSPVLERYHRLMQQGGLREYAEERGYVPAEPDADEGGGGLRLGASSAERGDLSIAEIRRQQVLEEEQVRSELLALVADAERCIGEGNLGAARVYLQQAARRASGSEKEAILNKLETIR